MSKKKNFMRTRLLFVAFTEKGVLCGALLIGRLDYTLWMFYFTIIVSGLIFYRAVEEFMKVNAKLFTCLFNGDISIKTECFSCFFTFNLSSKFLQLFYLLSLRTYDFFVCLIRQVYSAFCFIADADFLSSVWITLWN